MYCGAPSGRFSPAWTNFFEEPGSLPTFALPECAPANASQDFRLCLGDWIVLITNRSPEALTTLEVPDTSAADITQILDAVRLPATELQAPTVLHDSLEWRLSERYWQDAGCRPFAENSVPYMVNNSGRLSSNAARVLFQNLSEHPPCTARVVVLELGAGCGLFAKLFLDAFRSLCEEQHIDYYERLTYVVTDSSLRTIDHWAKTRLFEPHAAHVLPAHVDALAPRCPRIAGAEVTLRAVFCNYVLDVLPSTVWRRDGAQLEELQIATHWRSRGNTVAARPSISELREQVARAEVSAELLALWPELEFQTSFAPARALRRWETTARAMIAELPDRQRMVVSFGAFDSLASAGEQLETAGFMLVNDYGSVHATDAVGHSTPQRFGRTVALGLHFPLLERCLEGCGFHVVAPPGDEQRSVHTRLMSRVRLPVTQAAFAMCFARTTELELERPTALAREHFIAGRHGDALDAYREALSTNPGDWQLLGEVAEFVGLTVRDFSSGERIVRRAPELNAWTSAWLWNVLGDCLFCLERYPDAHAAFLEAHAIDANDARTHYNLSQTHALRGDVDAALVAIAHALARDAGLYRARLLQQQEHVLSALAARTHAEHAHVARRLERLGAS